jgi:hypothetical protein
VPVRAHVYKSGDSIVLDAMNDAVRDDHTRKDFSAIFEKYIHA